MRHSKWAIKQRAFVLALHNFSSYRERPTSNYFQRKKRQIAAPSEYIRVMSMQVVAFARYIWPSHRLAGPAIRYYSLSRAMIVWHRKDLARANKPIEMPFKPMSYIYEYRLT